MNENFPSSFFLKSIRALGGSAGLAAALLFAAPALHAQTVITNEGFFDANEPLPGGFSYGSRASTPDLNWTLSGGGTPNLTLAWQVGSSGDLDTYSSWDGRGSVVQVEPDPSGFWSISFIPDAGFGATLLSFDLDGWSGAPSAFNMDWSLSGSSSGTLASGNWSRTNAGGRDTITLGAPNIGLQGLGGETLTLDFHLLAGDHTYLAIDNLTFAQFSAIPEPSTYAAFAGLGALGLAVWRKRRAVAPLIRFLPLRPLLRLMLASSALAFLAPALRAQAIITWSTATTIAGDTDVATNGTSLYAYNLGSASTTAAVNGITFQVDLGAVTSNYTFSSTAAIDVYDRFNGAIPAIGSMNSEYQSLLNSARYAVGGDGSLTLKNLTVGQTYQLQLWVSDSRAREVGGIEVIGRHMTLSDNLGHDVSLAFNAGDISGSLGQYVTGTFTATGATEMISLLRGVGGDETAVQLNAFSVSAIPEPSTYAAFAGLGALGLAALRRRQSQFPT